MENLGSNTALWWRGKAQKRRNGAKFRPYTLFVISRSGVQVRSPAPKRWRRLRTGWAANHRNNLIFMGEFPSGQRGQTVNLLSTTSVVRIHSPPPFCKNLTRNCGIFVLYILKLLDYTSFLERWSGGAQKFLTCDESVLSPEF